VSASPQNPPMLITRIHKESSMCLECCYGAHHLH
jgi:hypothetical protein